jgi:hypothetical protein
MPTPQDLMGFGIHPFPAGELGVFPGAVTASGTTAGTAKVIPTDVHFAAVTGASSQTGVMLPSGAKIGTPYYIVGVGSAAPVVYPNTGATINNAAASLTLSAATATAILIRYSSTQWYSFPLAP